MYPSHRQAGESIKYHGRDESVTLKGSRVLKSCCCCCCCCCCSLYSVLHARQDVLHAYLSQKRPRFRHPQVHKAKGALIGSVVAQANAFLSFPRFIKKSDVAGEAKATPVSAQNRWPHKLAHHQRRSRGRERGRENQEAGCFFPHAPALSSHPVRLGLFPARSIENGYLSATLCLLAFGGANDSRTSQAEHMHCSLSLVDIKTQSTAHHIPPFLIARGAVS